MFKRTKSGLANEHLFYDVDYIVYCEGRSIAAAPDTAYSNSSLDEFYWKRVFEGQGIKAHVKSVGSKLDVMQIATEALDTTSDRIIAVVDSDYDRLLNRHIERNNIIYTYGYSWESDALSHFNVEAVMSLFTRLEDVEEARKKYNEFFNNAKKSLRRFVLVDARYIDTETALFDRNKPQSIVQLKSGDEPKICTEAFVAAVKRQRGRGLKASEFVQPRDIDGTRDFFGKTILNYVYHWFVFYSQKCNQRVKVAFETFINTVISTSNYADLDVARNAYYHIALSKLS